MKKLLLTSAMFLSFAFTSMAQKIGLNNFNDNWLFTESDSEVYPLKSYKPEGWRELDLPHDWSIEHSFSQELQGCTGFMPGGIGWYSKEFITEIDENKKCYVIFDGVYNNADFWMNGKKIGSHPYGYSPIYYDLTRYMDIEGKSNRLSVKVDRRFYVDSRWYTGSGIYRNVQTLVVDRLHVPVWGIFVTTPKISKESATVDFKIDVKNDYTTAKSGKVVTEIFGPNGDKISTLESNISLNSNEKTTVNQVASVKAPILWDVDSPKLYKANTYIVMDGKKLEERATTFGIRSFYFDKDKGFFLNGKNMKIKGVCLHHDAGLVGAAVPKDVWRRRLDTLKDMGCNAIRSAHNPASEEFLELCDELGFLVQNEFFDEWDLPKSKRYNMHERGGEYTTRGQSQHFEVWAERDLKNTMLSSRNHPSVFQWSIGNEIEWTYPGNSGATGMFDEVNINAKKDWTLWRGSKPPHTPEQVREYWKKFPKQKYYIQDRAKVLADWTREMDTTRPVIANCILPTSSFETGYAAILDIVGCSYKPDKYDYFREQYPQYTIMGTENIVRWYEWKTVIERDHISGLFLWTGVDYLGEKRENEWPSKATEHAPLDVAAFPRGSFYQFKSFWRDEPIITIFTQNTEKSTYKEENGKVVEKQKDLWKLAPRPWQDVNNFWNYDKGERVIVEIYSNCDDVELFLNGKSLGKQYIKDQYDMVFKWAVDYKKGKLVAKGSKGGKKTTTVMETTREPVAIRLMPDRTAVNANNRDVIHVVAQLVDSKGREVTNYDDKITFNIEGAHKFLGTDCGNTSKIDNFKNKTVETNFGKCLLAVQATYDPTTIKVTATSDKLNLSSEELDVTVK